MHSKNGSHINSRQNLPVRTMTCKESYFSIRLSTSKKYHAGAVSEVCPKYAPSDFARDVRDSQKIFRNMSFFNSVLIQVEKYAKLVC